MHHYNDSVPSGNPTTIFFLIEYKRSFTITNINEDELDGVDTLLYFRTQYYHLYFTLNEFKKVYKGTKGGNSGL